jgi:2,3-diketo-5-methylthio-1-phosphopentane phosphatase
MFFLPGAVHMSAPRFQSVLPEATVRIFTDFDGTITGEDVGKELYTKFCGAESFDRIRRSWLDGALTAPQAYRLLCQAIPRLTAAMLSDFLAAREIDPSFPDFAAWCEREAYPLTVLSDGVDAYITPLLEKAGVQVPVLCNRMRLGDASPEIDFPHFAHCKSNHVALLSRDEDIVVYVGDGTSDFEAATYADLVFARGELERFCQEQNVTFRRFYNFTTVRQQLSAMISAKGLRRRKRAEVRRRQLWARG